MNRIGPYLRSLRQSKNWSLGRLSEQSGIHKATLSRWESGAYEPRLPELEAVLKALGATSEQSETALSLVQAPRALHQLREIAQNRLMLHERSLPGLGDLLRAMRRRRGLSLDQAAEAMGVRANTVRRWEGSQHLPSEDTLQRLCDLLAAHPEERRALLSEGPYLRPSWEEGPLSLEQTDERIHMLSGRIERENALADLSLLTLEAQLWREAHRRPAASELLARTYALQARHLMLRGYTKDAAQYAGRSLETGGRILKDPYLRYSINVLGHHAAQSGRKPLPRKGAEALKYWLPLAADATTQISLYCDMAEHLSADGLYEEALSWLQKAERLYEQSEDFVGGMTFTYTQALILYRAGRLDSLSRVPNLEATLDHRFPKFDDFWSFLLAARIHIALGNRSSAHSFIQRAYGFTIKTGMNQALVEEVVRLL